MSEHARIEAEFKALAASGESDDHLVYAEVAGGELRALQVNRQLLDPDRQRALESKVRQAVNMALRAHHEGVVEFVKHHSVGADAAQLDRIEKRLDQIMERRR